MKAFHRKYKIPVAKVKEVWDLIVAENEEHNTDPFPVPCDKWL